MKQGLQRSKLTLVAQTRSGLRASGERQPLHEPDELGETPTLARRRGSLETSAAAPRHERDPAKKRGRGIPSDKRKLIFWVVALL